LRLHIRYRLLRIGNPQFAAADFLASLLLLLMPFRNPGFCSCLLLFRFLPGFGFQFCLRFLKFL
jgi:hypothetical protein